MARVTGLEPATLGVTGRYSNQLSYTRASVDEGPLGGGKIAVKVSRGFAEFSKLNLSARLTKLLTSLTSLLILPAKPLKSGNFCCSDATPEIAFQHLNDTPDFPQNLTISLPVQVH